MGVEVRKVKVLSMDAENEQYYTAKVLPGDGVELFFKDGTSSLGTITKIGEKTIEIQYRQSIKKAVVNVDSIKSYHLMFKGDLHNNYFH